MTENFLRAGKPSGDSKSGLKLFPVVLGEYTPVPNINC